MTESIESITQATSAGFLSSQVLRAYEEAALHSLLVSPIFPPGPPYVKPRLFSRRWWQRKRFNFTHARIWQWRIVNKDEWQRLETW